MKIAFIGDIVGRPGREMLKKHLKTLKEQHKLDLIVANTENASHGFGITPNNAKEIFSYGVDIMTGGNHSFDKKEIFNMMLTHPILRPINFNSSLPGKGVEIIEIDNQKVAIINAMGHYGMPQTNNVFEILQQQIDILKKNGIKHIFIDFHAETTAEKRGLMMMFQSEISGIVGTHTHIGTDDYEVENNTAYVTDIGLTGCKDGVIGMDSKIPIQKFLGQPWGHFDIPKKCKKILQLIIIECNEIGATSIEKIKIIE